MTATRSNRYRMDDLRRLATTLASGLEVAPSRASALATHLLWFDAAGASSHGIGTLPTWLGRIESKQVDPAETGRAVLEHAGTAVFDAKQGLAPLALQTAAGIASEKARDVGIGIVRVRNIGPTGPSAPVASSLAIGPFVAMIAGPSSSLSMALPTAEGLPSVFDSQLAGGSAPIPVGWMGNLSPWISAFTGNDDWVILAISVAAMESLPVFHDRVATAPQGTLQESGQLWPETWAKHREEVRERGVTLDQASQAGLKEWASRLNAPWPEELAG